MFYEGYNIDSKACAVNIRAGKKKKMAVFTFTEELYFGRTSKYMKIYISQQHLSLPANNLLLNH